MLADDRLVRIAIQRWFSRVATDPVLLQDEEVRSFVESDFGVSPAPPGIINTLGLSSDTISCPQYNPIPRPKRKAPSSFPLQLPLRKGPHDDDEELASAKFEVAKLDGQFADAAKAVDKLSKARKSQSTHQRGAALVFRQGADQGSSDRSGCVGGRLWKQAGDIGNDGTGPSTWSGDEEVRASARRDRRNAARSGPLRSSLTFAL